MPISGRALWKCDGTAAGTVLVREIWPDSTDRFRYTASRAGGSN
ncbi:MAG: hypothetical protein KDB27_14895 [Planctomycetales bacterium]|nr:hypothetical protein [Planctomycetales bacterium]